MLLKLNFFLIIFSTIFFFRCKEVSEFLNQGSGEPKKNKPTTEVKQQIKGLSSGKYLYCLTGGGKTLTPISLNSNQIITDSQRVIAYQDLVGPWFKGNKGYYISRVSGSGSGKNELFEFNPKTLKDNRSIKFPSLSNPNNVLILPNTWDTAWVPLKGSSFSSDQWINNGIASINLRTLTQSGYFDLNHTDNYAEGSVVVSMAELIYDTSRNLVYAVATNWNGSVQNGWIFVLAISSEGNPVLKDQIKLERNPQGKMVLFNNELWISHTLDSYGGDGGLVQVWDTTTFDDGNTGATLLKTINFSQDPTGVHLFSTSKIWINMYPNFKVQTIDLTTKNINPSNTSLPRVSGRLIKTTNSALYGIIGGFGHSYVERIDSSTGLSNQTIDLQAGIGPSDCAEYQVP